MPSPLQPGVLYISQKYRTASHLCACGCGERVVTPLSESRWKIIAGDAGISLYPSIGNWNYACRSHYWIWHGKIEWSGQMSARRIASIQNRDHLDKVQEIEIINREKLRSTTNKGFWQHLYVATCRFVAGLWSKMSISWNSAKRKKG